MSVQVSSNEAVGFKLTKSDAERDLLLSKAASSLGAISIEVVAETGERINWGQIVHTLREDEKELRLRGPDRQSLDELVQAVDQQLEQQNLGAPYAH